MLTTMVMRNPNIAIILASVTSFLICYLSIPSIIKVARVKNLFDCPDERKFHKSNVPTLGGIAIFAGFIFATTFWANPNNLVDLQYIICALIVVFFMGMKDDIVNLVAYKKLMGQALAAAIIIFLSDIRLTSLYGLFQVYDISYTLSVIVSILTIVSITNAFNLIDGVDTLAGSIGIVTTTIFGTWFFLTGHTHYAILSASLLGALIAFLRFNITPAKIFMGDTGSLILGLVNSVLAIKFIEFNKVYAGSYEYKVFSVPAVTIGILIIPVFDTLRVFSIRILKGLSPLSPDRNHLHHLLKDIGLSDLKTSFTLVSVNLIIVIISFTFQKTTGEILLFSNFCLMILFSWYLNNKKLKKQKSNLRIISNNTKTDKLKNINK